jgi:hypothetical protein
MALHSRYGFPCRGVALTYDAAVESQNLSVAKRSSHLYAYDSHDDLP